MTKSINELKEKLQEDLSLSIETMIKILCYPYEEFEWTQVNYYYTTHFAPLTKIYSKYWKMSYPIMLYINGGKYIRLSFTRLNGGEEFFVYYKESFNSTKKCYYPEMVLVSLEEQRKMPNDNFTFSNKIEVVNKLFNTDSELLFEKILTDSSNDKKINQTTITTSTSTYKTSLTIEDLLTRELTSDNLDKALKKIFNKSTNDLVNFKEDNEEFSYLELDQQEVTIIFNRVPFIQDYLYSYEGYVIGELPKKGLKPHTNSSAEFIINLYKNNLANTETKSINQLKEKIKEETEPIKREIVRLVKEACSYYKEKSLTRQGILINLKGDFDLELIDSTFSDDYGEYLIVTVYYGEKAISLFFLKERKTAFFPTFKFYGYKLAEHFKSAPLILDTVNLKPYIDSFFGEDTQYLFDKINIKTSVTKPAAKNSKVIYPTKKQTNNSVNKPTKPLSELLNKATVKSNVLSGSSTFKSSVSIEKESTTKNPIIINDW